MPTGIATVAMLLAAACGRAPESAADIVARSVRAHGGPALTSWTTMTVKGRVRLQDGIAYNAAYALYAQAPGKLRVEHDLTADRGRAFYEYFLNDGAAWTRRNLVVSPYDPARAQRLLDQCYGVALYARPGLVLERRPDAPVIWPVTDAWRPPADPAPRPAYVLATQAGNEPRQIWIDPETFFLLKETAGPVTRYYADVRPFGGVRLATRVLEVSRSQNRETVTPFVFEAVAFNVPLDPALFIEDRPRADRAARPAGANPE